MQARQPLELGLARGRLVLARELRRVGLGQLARVARLLVKRDERADRLGVRRPGLLDPHHLLERAHRRPALLQPIALEKTDPEPQLGAHRDRLFLGGLPLEQPHALVEPVMEQPFQFAPAPLGDVEPLEPILRAGACRLEREHLDKAAIARAESCSSSAHSPASLCRCWARIAGSLASSARRAKIPASSTKSFSPR